MVCIVPIVCGNQGDNRKNSTTRVTNGKMPPDFVFEFHV